MNLLDFLQLAMTILVVILGVRLEFQVRRLSVGIDQSLQILHRAREAVIKIHGAYIFLVGYVKCQEENNELCMRMVAEKSAYEAELKGLAIAIGDKELIDLIDKKYSFISIPIKERDKNLVETEIRAKSELLHMRISQLIKIATK